MSSFFCPTKEKNVEVYIKGIPASSLENTTTKVISGRIKCSGSDMKCTSKTCPFLMDK